MKIDYRDVCWSFKSLIIIIIINDRWICEILRCSDKWIIDLCVCVSFPTFAFVVIQKNAIYNAMLIAFVCTKIIVDFMRRIRSVSRKVSPSCTLRRNDLQHFTQGTLHSLRDYLSARRLYSLCQLFTTPKNLSHPWNYFKSTMVYTECLD